MNCVKTTTLDDIVGENIILKDYCFSNFKKLIYLFLAVLFSSCGKQGLLSSCGVQAANCNDFCH